MKLLLRLTLALIVLAAIVSCDKKENKPTPTPSRPEPTAIESPLSPLAAPAAVDSPLPPPNERRFSLDKPVIAGATEVSGHGPVGIPLQVVDVTSGGEILGSGTIDSDGNFEIKLGIPIEANRVIGIQLAIAKNPDTWGSLWALRGEDARAIPQVGEFFDSVVSSSE